MTTQHSLIACVRNSRHRAHVFLYTRACSTCNHIARIVLSYIPPHPTFSLVPTLEKTCPVLLWSKSGPSYQNINILCQSSEKTQYFHSLPFLHCPVLVMHILHSSASYTERKNHLVYSFFLKMSLLFSYLLTQSKFLSICALCVLTSPGWEAQLVSLAGLEQNVCGTKD